MMKTIKIEDLRCVCVANGSGSRVVYMIYPHINGFDETWLEGQSKKNGCSIVMVDVPLDKWNDYLTPWPEPGESPKAEPFAGEAYEFLKILQNKVIPKAEETLGIAEVKDRDLMGVSLGGLFAFWQWMQCDTFRSIACLSGSFWYMGFMEWFEKQPIPLKQGKAYFLLGTEEPKANIKAYRPVGINTEAIVATLKKAGIQTEFDWVPGNHFTDPLQRAQKVLEYLARM